MTSRRLNACEIAVIGAGPYGLSVAAHLRQAGLTTKVFGEPMWFWRHHMPKGMRLRSPWRATHMSDPAEKFSLDAFAVEHRADRNRAAHARQLHRLWRLVLQPCRRRCRLPHGAKRRSHRRRLSDRARRRRHFCRPPGRHRHRTGQPGSPAAAVCRRCRTRWSATPATIPTWRRFAAGTLQWSAAARARPNTRCSLPKPAPKWS